MSKSIDKDGKVFVRTWRCEIDPRVDRYVFLVSDWYPCTEEFYCCREVPCRYFENKDAAKQLFILTIADMTSAINYRLP